MDYTGKWVVVFLLEFGDEEAKGSVAGRAVAINPIGIMVAVSESMHALIPWTSVREVNIELDK